MKKNIALTIAFGLILFVCYYFNNKMGNLDEDIMVLNAEIDALKEDTSALRKEVFEITFGKETLFKNLQEFIKMEEYSKAKNSILHLNEFHSESIEAAEANKLMSMVQEELNWSEIIFKKDSVTELNQNNRFSMGEKGIISYVEKYIEKYPDGKHIVEAKMLADIIKKDMESIAYEYAKKQNSSYAWSNFLKEYPNHIEANSIEKKIISLEVNEIIGKNDTGKLPTFSRTNYSSSSNSSVTITNDTGYQLTLRYSGPSVIKITIPIGGTRTTSLLSGSYRIAASAGGLNYGGSEYLSGNYSSSYYIQTTRY